MRCSPAGLLSGEYPTRSSLERISMAGCLIEYVLENVVYIYGVLLRKGEYLSCVNTTRGDGAWGSRRQGCYRPVKRSQRSVRFELSSNETELFRSEAEESGRTVCLLTLGATSNDYQWLLLLLSALLLFGLR